MAIRDLKGACPVGSTIIGEERIPFMGSLPPGGTNRDGQKEKANLSITSLKSQ